MDAPWKLPNALVQLQTRYTIAAKPHPKIACLLQRSLDRRGSKARLICVETFDASAPYATYVRQLRDNPCRSRAG